MTKQKRMLEAIRQSIRDEDISYGEIAVLQTLIDYIEPDDIELLQWAGEATND